MGEGFKCLSNILFLFKFVFKYTSCSVVKQFDSGAKRHDSGVKQVVSSRKRRVSVGNILFLFGTNRFLTETAFPAGSGHRGAFLDRSGVSVEKHSLFFSVYS